MKIVVLDGYTENPGDLSWAPLEELGELTVYPRTPVEEIINRIGDAEIVYTNKTQLTSDTLDACPGIRFIGVLATGYNVVDVDVARARGIPVCNVPTYGTAAVAQFTFALLLELCHHVGAHADSVRVGEWSRCEDFCYWKYPLIELKGKTMGIIGFGRIGRAVAAIAVAFGMEVLAYDSHKNPGFENDMIRYADLDLVYSQSDVISLHCPLFPETEKMINSSALGRMKKGVMLLNTSRGGLVEENSLAAALRDGTVAGVALDVVSTEPIRMDNPLLGIPNCLITPHIAWAPKESRQRLMDVAVENLRAFVAGKPHNVVNPAI